MAQLDDPVALGHLRAAYTFLGSAKLHYCQNCDEEWVVFTDEWPRGGVACAGPKAGVCETILRAGYQASWARQGYCSRCATRSAYSIMLSADNLQHLGPRHEALSNLTWYESLLIARVHPVISVVTLTATGLLCYAGHVCNYYVKILEWFKELPACLRDKKWFLVKRRKHIFKSESADTRQKKPTTANRRRLETAIAVVKSLMPNVYKDSLGPQDSELAHEELAKFAWDQETEMLEQSVAEDLSGEVRLERVVFSEWLDSRQKNRERYPCAVALMRYAIDQQGLELRGAVTGDTAWELCCRLLSQPDNARSLGTSTLAQLIVYWLGPDTDGSIQLPAEMRQAIYKGMQEDLIGRGKRVETASDEQAMQSRWVKQLIHRELDQVREAWLGSAVDMPVDLDVDFEMQEPEHASMVAESEKEAAKLLTKVAGDGTHDSMPLENYWADWEEDYWASWDDHFWNDSDWGDCWSEPEEEWYDACEEWSEQPAVEQHAQAPSSPKKPRAELGTASADKPLVDPPEFGDRIRDTDREP